MPAIPPQKGWPIPLIINVLHGPGAAIYSDYPMAKATRPCDNVLNTLTTPD